MAARCFLSEPRFNRRQRDLRQRWPGESHREQVPTASGVWEQSANERAVLRVPRVPRVARGGTAGAHGGMNVHSCPVPAIPSRQGKWPLLLCVSSHTEGEASLKSHSIVHCGHGTDTGEPDPRVHLLIA